jgi:hypothetical protein
LHKDSNEDRIDWIGRKQVGEFVEASNRLDTEWLARHNLNMTAHAVYHYISPSGFQGLVERKCLWATNLRYFNDAEEFNYGRRIIKTELEAIRSANPGTVYDRVLEQVIQHLEWMTDYEFFACCFSLKGDLLSQWRAYASDGFGYSIGFEWQHLVHVLPVSGTAGMPPRMNRVIYSQAAQREFIRLQFDKLKILVNMLGDDPDHDTGLIEFMQKNTEGILPLCKHPAFEEEDEFRICFGRDNFRYPEDVKLRQGKACLVPYTELLLPEAVRTYIIREVILGPKMHNDAAKAKWSALVMLRNNGFTFTDVHTSQLPYV